MTKKGINATSVNIFYFWCKQTWQIVKTFLFFTFYLVNLERSGLTPVWIWNKHPHPLIYVWGIKIQSLTHKSEDEDVCFYIGLRAAKITLWAFESKSHLDRKIAPREKPSSDLLKKYKNTHFLLQTVFRNIYLFWREVFTISSSCWNTILWGNTRTWRV